MNKAIVVLVACLAALAGCGKSDKEKSQEAAMEILRQARPASDAAAQHNAGAQEIMRQLHDQKEKEKK